MMKKTEKKMKHSYFESIITIGSLHRLFLESIKVELGRRRIRNISSVQCLAIYRIGQSSFAGKANLSYTDLYTLYQSLVSSSELTYILKKLVKNGYVTQKYTEADKPTKYYSLSEKGLALYDRLNALFEEYLQQMEKCGLSTADLKNLARMTLKLQKVCKNIILPPKTAMKKE